jgi:hypothetical protein
MSAATDIVDLAAARREGGANAWRISFADKPIAGRAPLAVIERPRPVWAYSELIDLHAVLEDETPPKSDSAGFVFVFLPVGAATPHEVQRRGETWMASRPDETDASLETMFRNERVLWRRGRALCVGTAASLDDMLSAVVHFSFCEHLLARLEDEAEGSWPTIENDVGFTDGFRRRTLKRRYHIEAMNRAVTFMLMEYVRVQNALEMPTAALAGPARRIFAELALQANVSARLEALDDAIDVIDDFYRLANERLTDYRTYLRERWIEVGILVVLFAELVVTAYQVFR